MADRIELVDGKYRVYFGWGPNNERIRAAIKLIPGWRFVSKDNSPDGVAHWTLPRNDRTVLLAAQLAAGYNMLFLQDGQAVDTTQAQAAAKAAFAQTVVDSKAHSADPFDIKWLNPQMTPRPYQWAGVRYSLDAIKRGYGVLIADDIGLGKTIEAIMLIAAADAFPCLVLTLASVKIGFGREVEKWLPGKRVLVLDGRAAIDPREYRQADIIISNYDIISTVTTDPTRVTRNGKPYDVPKPDTHLEMLLGQRLKGLVLDECHKIKDYKTQTSRAAKLLAKVVGRGLKVALTGTPLLNRSQELMSTLMILDHLDALGGFWVVARRYCGHVEGQGFGAAKVTEEVRIELHNKMRETGYLRRLRSEVLADLPPSNPPVIVPMKLDNQKAYDKAQNHMADYLESVGQSRNGFDRAEALVQLGVLRTLAAKGKLKAVIEWINSFLETGHKFVVFADHIEIQHALVDAFPDCTYIRGEDTAAKRQVQIDRFQSDPDVSLMVASLKAGGTGVDGLQNVAHNLGFVELGWNPGQMDQASGRLDRSGQKNAVTSYYFIADNTVDGDMLELLDAKRELVAAITDGEGKESLEKRQALLTKLGKNDDGSPNTDIVKELAQRLYARSGRAELNAA